MTHGKFNVHDRERRSALEYAPLDLNKVIVAINNNNLHVVVFLFSDQYALSTHCNRKYPRYSHTLFWYPGKSNTVGHGLLPSQTAPIYVSTSSWSRFKVIRDDADIICT